MPTIEALYETEVRLSVAGPIRYILCKNCKEELMSLDTPAFISFKKHIKESHPILNKIFN